MLMDGQLLKRDGWMDGWDSRELGSDKLYCVIRSNLHVANRESASNIVQSSWVTRMSCSLRVNLNKQVSHCNEFPKYPDVQS
jgi:hypothetical protein